MLTLGLVQSLFHSGKLSIRSKGLVQVEAAGMLRLNPEDAAQLTVSAGDRVTLSNERGSCTTTVKLLDRVPRGFAWFPDHFAQDMTQLCEITIDKETKVPSFRAALVSVVKVE